MEISLAGQIALITGSARRVGKTIALALAAQGCHIALHHRSSPHEAEETAAQIRALGVDCLILQGDHRHHQQVAANFAALAAHFGRCDLLVNSAGSFTQGDFLEVSPEDWEDALGANLSGPFWCCQQAGRLMRDSGRGGCIINIGDNGGWVGWAKRPQHSISKAGVVMLSQVAAKALAKYQIRVNCIIPGPILPAADMDADYWAKVVARLPLGHEGQPEDLARAAVFVARNDFMTGAVLHVDGGEHLGA
jgi:NAD(P)-dependent dehydrogenase (short-subunit alcohol dehydrogenase family)